MKFLSKKEFLNLPAGLVFAKFKPIIFEELQVKGDTHVLQNDYYYSNFIEVDSEDAVDTIFRSLDSGESVPLHDNTWMRDGDYNEEQLYAVFEKQDVEQMVERLQESLESYPAIPSEPGLLKGGDIQ